MRNTYTSGQNDFIRQYGAQMPTKQLCAAINKKFGCSHTEQSVRTHTKKLGITKTKETIRQSRKHDETIGSVRIVNGFRYIKITNRFDNFYQNWMPLHRRVWEQIHGKIPNDHRVIFLDGNKFNCHIDNLACVSNKIMARMANGHGKALWSGNAEITKTALLVCELDSHIST